MMGATPKRAGCVAWTVEGLLGSVVLEAKSPSELEGWRTRKARDGFDAGSKVGALLTLSLDEVRIGGT